MPETNNPSIDLIPAFISLDGRQPRDQIVGLRIDNTQNSSIYVIRPGNSRAESRVLRDNYGISDPAMLQTGSKLTLPNSPSFNLTASHLLNGDLSGYELTVGQLTPLTKYYSIMAGFDDPNNPNTKKFEQFMAGLKIGVHMSQIGISLIQNDVTTAALTQDGFHMNPQFFAGETYANTNGEWRNGKRVGSFRSDFQADRPYFEYVGAVQDFQYSNSETARAKQTGKTVPKSTRLIVGMSLASMNFGELNQRVMNMLDLGKPAQEKVSAEKIAVIATPTHRLQWVTA